MFQLKTENRVLINKIFSDSKIVDYAHFINSCLYDKEFGYYNNSSISKDFFTSPVTHDSFGKILCKQIKEIWDYYKNPRQFVIVEVGGNEGKLKKDILESASKNKKFYNSVVYLNIDKVNEDDILNINFKADIGCIISNEFFDALPFNRFIKEEGEVKKLFIELRENELLEIKKELKDFDFFDKEIISKIPDGSKFEIIENIDLICAKLSSFFNNCIMVTVDYGFNKYDNLFFKNPNGLVRCYSNHSMNKNILENIGNKDITCDVNFNLLNDCLSKHGLIKIGNTSQEKFLIKNGLKKYFDNASINEKKNLISLVNPDGLGAFHVYFHEKPYLGFEPSCLEN